MYIKSRAFESNFAKIVITEFLLCELSDFFFNFYLYLPVLIEKGDVIIIKFFSFSN